MEPLIKNGEPTLNAYLSQKAKNEQIVTDCKKLLVQLEQLEND